MTTHALVEGYLDGRLLQVIWRQLGHEPADLAIRDAGGGPAFWRIAQRYNAAGRHRTVLGLTDLEQTECAPSMLKTLDGGRSDGFRLRLAVRMLESWLLADRASFAAFLGVRVNLIPIDPDSEVHPKRTVGRIAAQSSKRRIREGLVPAHASGLVGPEFTSLMSDFIESHWDHERARETSASLDRACHRWQTV